MILKKDNLEGRKVEAKVKRESKQFKNMIKLIHEMECELGDIPELNQICERTGLLPVTAIKTLNNIDFYPKEKLITPNEKLVLNVFRIGLKVSDISEMTGLSISTTSKIMARLGEKSLIDYKPAKRARLNDKNKDSETFIVVTEGEYTGARGYIKKITNAIICDLWHNGEFIEDVKLQTGDSKEIKKYKIAKRCS